MRVNNTPLFFKSRYFIYKIQTHIRVEGYLRGKRLLSHTLGLFGKLEGRKPFPLKYISRCILYAACSNTVFLFRIFCSMSDPIKLCMCDSTKKKNNRSFKNHAKIYI